MSKPISDRWIDDVIEYGYNPRLIQESKVTIRKLARELQRTRQAIRDSKAGNEDISRFDIELWRATLPESDKP